jgi:tetratricopeptide (TPR) repeat protein
MSRRRSLLLFVFSLLIIGASYLIVGRRNVETPAIVETISMGLDNGGVARATKTSSELIAFWYSRTERDPRDYISLTHLGQAYINQARETGDASAYARAEAALQRALELRPDYKTALAYMSTLLFVQHDFQGALESAERVYSSDPRALHALATIGDAQLELGHYAEAGAAYQVLLEQNASPPVYSRLANLAWLQGRPEDAITLMQQAANEAVAFDLAGENIAWYYVQLAELYFNTGQLALASEHYQKAREYFDPYYLALAGMAKVYAAQGEYDKAIAFYEQVIAMIPQPDFLAELGDLYMLVGNVEAAQRHYETVAFIANLEAINQVIYNRQLALYYANHDLHLAEALDLATRELSVRQDIYAYDTFAWALFKNGRYQEAAEAMVQAMKLGTQDALLYYHAGLIQAALGDRQGAREMLTTALNINPYFGLLQAPIAQTTLIELQTEAN